MKKLLMLLLLICGIAQAEELKFVTVLSSPVGTFNQLEAVDSETTAKSPVINFCTGLGNGGTITLQGAAHPEADTLNLSNGTTLGGNGKDYVLNTLTMRQGGTLKGSRLLANVMQVASGGMGVSENLYSNDLTVAGAKTAALHVNGSDAFIKDPGPAGVNMVWSNQYQGDKACGANCKDQYLLKQKGSAVVECNLSDKPDDSRKCNGCGTQSREVTCNQQTGKWETGAWQACAGGAPSQTEETERCVFSTSYKYSSESDSPSGSISTSQLTGTKKRVWNNNTCNWGPWSKCQGSYYVSFGSFTKSGNKAYCKKASSRFCSKSYGLNEACDWAQSGGLSADYCTVPYNVDGCYIYQCKVLQEK